MSIPVSSPHSLRLSSFIDQSIDLRLRLCSTLRLKWKPPSENSIDFLLQLKFPPLPDQPKEVDFTAKPRFMLMMNHGHEGTHYFDTMEVEDSTWEE